MGLAAAGCITLAATSAALLAWGEDAAAEHRPARCFAAGPAITGRTFYIDPATGSDDGDGSRERPWRSFAEVVSRGLIGDRTYAPSPIRRVLGRLNQRWAYSSPRRNGDAVVHGGDRIYLMDGEHGEIAIYGLVNDAPITIAALPGATAVVSAISVGRSRDFAFRDLVVSPPPGTGSGFAVTTRRSPDMPRSTDIRFARLDIRGPGNIADTSPDTWASQGRDGVLLFGDCLALEDSTISNVRYGAAIYQTDRATIARNTIKDFAVDGIDFTGNDVVIADNVITDHWPAGAGLDSDCIQGQVSAKDPIYRRIRVTGNVCLSDTGPRHSRELQGINIFDGHWQDLTVSCNFVRPSIYHGITLMGVDRALVERNVVQGWGPDKTPWIAVFASKEGRQPTDALIRHNRATAYLNAADGAGADPDRLVNSIRLGPDATFFRQYVQQRVTGVTLADNAWMLPGPDMSRDRRFAQPALQAVRGPISVEQAKASIAEICPRPAG